MIREQSRFSINPLYIVGLACCCLSAYTTTLQSGLLLGLVTVVTALLCVNVVSLVEKIADKNLRAFLIAMFAATICVLAQYVFKVIDKPIFTQNVDSLKWVVLAVISLSIVPTYFESRLTTSDYYKSLFFSIIAYFVITIIYSIIVELMASGTIWGQHIIAGFDGFEFASALFFELFVIGVLVIIFNVVYQKVEDKNMKFQLLVSRYKTIIKQTLINKHREETKNGK